MIPKIVRGKGFGGLLRYVFGEGKNAEIVCSNLMSIDPEEIAKELREIASRRQNITKPVWHCSLSLAPGERLPDAGWEAVVRDYMTRVGFPKDAAFVAVRHQDNGQDHVHIVASRVNPDGTVFLGRWEAKKAIRICRELEKQYQLKEVVDQKKSLNLTQGEFKKAVRTKEVPARLQAKAILEEVLRRKPETMSEFVQLTLDGGLEVIPNISKTSGKLNGFAFALGGVSFKASQVGKQFSVANLQKAGISYEPNRDAEFLKRLVGQVVVPAVKPSPLAKEKSDLFKRYQADREEQWRRHNDNMSVRLDEINGRVARRKAAAEKLFKKSMEDAYEIKRGFFRDRFRDEMHDLYRKTLKEIYEDANAERQRLFEDQKIEKLNWRHWLELQAICGDTVAKKELQRRKEYGTGRYAERSSRTISDTRQPKGRLEDRRRPDRTVTETPNGTARQNQIGCGDASQAIRGNLKSGIRAGAVPQGTSGRAKDDLGAARNEHCHNDIFDSIERLRTLSKTDLEKLVRRVSNEERSRSRLEAIPTALRAQLCDRRSKRDVQGDDLLQVRNGKLDGQRSGGQMQMPQDNADNLLNCGGIASDSGLRCNDAVHDQPGFRVVNPMIEDAIRRAIARDPEALAEFAKQGLVEIEGGQAVERQNQPQKNDQSVVDRRRLRR